MSGLRVVIPRSVEQSLEFARGLTAYGAVPVVVPCLQRVSLAGELGESLRALRDYDVVVVSSAGAAAEFAGAMRGLGVSPRALVAVGVRTQAVLNAQGVFGSECPEESTSEGVAALLKARGWLGKRVLHVCAAQAREVLETEIARGGGVYVRAPAYRLAGATLTEDLRQRLSLARPRPFGEGAADALCMTSGLVAQNLLRLMEEAWGAEETREVLGSAKIISLGPVTSQAAVELGLRVHAQAREPTDEGMLRALLQAFSTG